jgi:Actinobacteria/chloroflexi VLRF1 release factor
MKNPAAGGGRWVDVPPERLVSWIVTFTQRHGAGPVSGDEAGVAVTFTAADGAVAECHPPFPPLHPPFPPLHPPFPPLQLAFPPPRPAFPPLQPPFPPPRPAGSDDPAAIPAAIAAAIAAHATAERTVGVLLVRLGGYAVGVFAGSPPRLVSSKTGSRPVHGRSAAGGWSQHRFARRRENQAATALRAAADAAVSIFGPHHLDQLVLGGDKRSIAGIRGDPRLARYLALATERFLTVPDPRLAVLKEISRSFLSVRIRVTEPKPDSPA